MTKGELIEKIAAEAKISKDQAKRSMEAFQGLVAKSLAKSGRLTLTGFGSFSVAATPARMGRNPQNGEPIAIKAGKRIKFKAGKLLKEAV